MDWRPRPFLGVTPASKETSAWNFEFLQFMGEGGYECTQDNGDHSRRVRPLMEGLNAGSGLTDLHAAVARSVTNNDETLACIARALKEVRQPNFTADLGIRGDSTIFLYYCSQFKGRRKTRIGHGTD